MSFLDNVKYRFVNFSIPEKIILINVVCFTLPMVLNVLFFLFNIPSSAYMNWLQLSPNLGTFITRPWTLLSYSFIHSGFFHLLWNMVLLFYAGRLLLNLFPDRIFINNYFLGIIAGGLIFIGSYAFFPVFSGTYPPMIGASAGVMAVFIFICTYTPNQEFRFFFVNLKLKYLGLAFFFLDVIQIPYGNAGGHLAHIGGAVLGFFYARQLSIGRDIGSGFQGVWQSIFAKKHLKTVYRAPQNKSAASKNSGESDHQNKIDSILDKISKSGYDSLSKEEKDYLFRAGKE
jgi:membrane associated rhomboid family serine protease